MGEAEEGSGRRSEGEGSGVEEAVASVRSRELCSQEIHLPHPLRLVLDLSLEQEGQEGRAGEEGGPANPAISSW